MPESKVKALNGLLGLFLGENGGGTTFCAISMSFPLPVSHNQSPIALGRYTECQYKRESRSPPILDVSSCLMNGMMGMPVTGMHDSECCSLR